MHLSTNKKRDDVATSIRSLLITHQDDVTIPMLERDYRDIEEESIPFREFNCPTLLCFLRQLHDYVHVENKNGRIVLRPVLSEKSKHINEFVKNQKPKNTNHKRKFQKPYQGFCANRSRVSINHSLLTELVSCINLCPHGLPINYAIQFVNQYIRPLQITRQELEHQLRQLSHTVIIHGDKLFPVNNIPFFTQPFFNNFYAYNQSWQTTGFFNLQVPNNNVYKNTAYQQKMINEKIPLVVKGANNVYQPNDKLKFLPAGYAQSKQTDNKIGSQNDESCLQGNKSNEINDKIDNCNVEKLIENDRDLTISTRIKLSKLIQQFPHGILCTELQKIYHDLYKIPLKYSETEFSSILDYVAHLPKVFHCVKPLNEKNYKLFNAKNPLPNLINDEPRNLKKSARELNLDASQSALLKEVLGIDDFVKHLSATEFGQNNGCEEIKICKVISPSFFWLHLMKNLINFKEFNNDLNTFYENNQRKFIVPSPLLQKGLNVVCHFNDKWNRGLVKEICYPQVTIFFYDYAIEKKIFPDSIHFLHRSFSNFPIQAIPCRLFNVKPYQTENWSKDIIWEFESKTAYPLIATAKDVNLDENLLSVILTDTRTDIDFCISDWMCREQFGEPGQDILRHHNVPFLHYKKCLEQKGYDPLSLHNIRSEGVKLNEEEEESTPETSPKSAKEIYEQKQLRMKRLLASYAKSKAKQAEISVDNLPPLKEITSSTEEKSVENVKITKREKLLSFRKVNNLTKSNCNGSVGDSGESTENSFRKLNSNTSNSNTDEDLESAKEPLPEMSYFGTFGSECGGRGRFEPINWGEVLNTNKEEEQEKNRGEPTKNQESILEKENDREKLNYAHPLLRRLHKLQII